MSTNDRRLIEEFLPVDHISDAASSEPRTKGHISTLHLWRARRPLAACRAAIYASLIPAPSTEEEREQKSRFLSGLCSWAASKTLIEKARNDIRAATHGRIPRVLDSFAGGGSIPLEALRLGCEAYSMDLNPVAFLIEKATVEYPQRFGMTLAGDVRKWAGWVTDRVRSQVAPLYPLIPVPPSLRKQAERQGAFGDGPGKGPVGLVPFAFLWARTVKCPNRQCQATVPLFAQTWLRRKSSGYVALRPRPDRKKRLVFFEVMNADREDDFDFDPSDGMSGTATNCLCCKSSVPAKYIREYGESPGYGQQLLCVMVVNPYGTGKLYLADDSWVEGEAERQAIAEERARALEAELQVTTLDEVIPPTGNAGLATGKSYLYGIRTFRQAYTPRQRYVLLEFVRKIQGAHDAMVAEGLATERAEAVTVYLALWLSRLTDRFNALARWNNVGEKVESYLSMKRIAMTWDFPEVNLFGGGSGDCRKALDFVTAVIEREAESGRPAIVIRGSASGLTGECFADNSFDAVVTDPPYYDNESYSELSDVFYIWLKPTLGHLFREHFAGQLTPKRQECVAAAYRQGGDQAAKRFFEKCLGDALKEAHRVLRDDGVLVLVYAHKTTSGWSTLVEALREAGFEVREAWPIETEAKARAAHQGDAALASSIFFAARPRKGALIGNYEDAVRPELERIARERVATLWQDGKGIGGADLLMAAVGAGLRAYTQFAHVERANGVEVTAEEYLREVEGVVLDTMLEQVFGMSKAGVSAVDPLTRFYVLWRFAYRESAIEAGEAFVFCYPQGIEIDGPIGISGPVPKLVEKSGKTYKVRTFEDRGDNESLGVAQDGVPPPTIDTLHRLLWLLEHAPAQIAAYLRRANPNLEQLRLVAQALRGPVLKRVDSLAGSLTPELSALTKLTDNWRSIVEGAAVGAEAEARRSGQTQLPLGRRET